MEVSGQLQAQAAYPLERTPVPIEYEVGWAPEPVRTVLQKGQCLDFAMILIPNPPGRS
jgi:hypothetical protein